MTLFIDGSVTGAKSATRIILPSPEGFQVQQAIRFNFMTTNNIVEYEALIAKLRLTKSLIAQNLTIHSDSQLAVKHISGEYEAKETHLQQYLQLVLPMLASFKSYKLIGIIRAENVMADALSKLAATDRNTLEGSIY